MLGYLILLFIGVPLIELTILMKVSQLLGIGYTLGLVIFTGVLGAYLARWQGFVTLRKIQEDVNNGRMPTDKLFDGALVLCSGLLLLTPGLITDLIGFIGLIPFSRNLVKLWLKRKVKDMLSQGKIITIKPFKFL
ncbi:MAG: FxsA family protein [Candidatus Susulua stagnicola]|nr:FxsA family protein [Candidatus Susulua stagnicola]